MKRASFWIAMLGLCAACKKSTVSVTPDAKSPPSTAQKKVWLGPDGADVESNGKHLAAGCSGEGPGVTVPKKNGAFDDDGLRACFLELKKTASDFNVEIAATNDTPYQAIIGAIDAVREDASRAPLFPGFSLGFPRSGANAAAVDAPPAPAGFADKDEGIIVLISKTEVKVDDTSIAPVPADATRGLAATHKKGGIDDVVIVPLVTEIKKRVATDQKIKEATGKKGPSSAILIADQNTPYRLLFEVFYTLTQSGCPTIHLMVKQKG